MTGNRIRLFEDAFRKGLSPLRRTPANAPVLAEAYGFRPSPAGVQPYVPVAALTGAHATAWPYPQISRGALLLLSFGETSVRLVNPDTGTYSTLPTYDARATATPKAIPSGGVWHVADFGAFWMASNGACMVYQELGGSKVFVETNCYPKTLCSFRGWPVFGGIVGYPTEWADFWAAHTADALIADLCTANVWLEGNAVCWGSPDGSGAFAWFRQDISETGYVAGINDAANPHLLERLEANAVGYQYMPWPSDVLCVKPFENGVVVYGRHNVGALVSQPPSFGYRDVAPVGIAGRGAVGGDEHEHVFVDPAGAVYRLRGDLSIERLDYSVHGAGLVSKNPLVVLNPVEREYWIGCSDRGYLLNGAGLVECTQHVTAAHAYDGAVRGSAATLKAGFRAVSWLQDGGTRRPKTITGLELGARNPQAYTLTVQHRMNAGDAWQASAESTPTREGFVAGLHLSCVEFRVVVESDEAEPDIDYVDVILGGTKAAFGSF